VKRWVAYALALGVLSVLPFRDAIATGGLPGAGPDVLSTVWGMWWFQQEWAGAAWGGWTELVNYPRGAFGAVLGISGAITWALTDPVLGPGGAAVLVNATQLTALALATAMLARRLGASTTGAMVAGGALFVSRYLFFDAGEGSIVAVAALPIPLGLAAMTGRGLGPALGLAACIAWAALENPYLAPVLPAVALFWMLRDRDVWKLAGLGLGSGLTLAITALFSKAANPDYPHVSQIDHGTYTIGPWTLTAIDVPWARATVGELLWPGAVSWTTDPTNAVDAAGGTYLGLSLVAASVAAGVLLRSRAWGWLALALACGLLALGSVTAGPFLLLNALMDAIARPLTQPTRFLAVGLVALAVPTGLLWDELHARWGRLAWALPALLAADALLFGGLSLKAPSTALPEAACVLGLDGPVLVWPTDAQAMYAAPSQTLQLLHEQPSPHRGIASWRQHEQSVLADLQAAGFALQAERRGEPDAEALKALGYRWVVTIEGAQALPTAFATTVYGRCGEYVVYSL